MTTKNIAVIGGGAAGYFSAITAAQHHTQGRVFLFEASKKPLAKVLVSGGGRCNVTHSCFSASELVKNYPRGSRELLGPFSRFQASDTVSWFADRGIELKTEADGRMFPITDSSETIANCLKNSAKQSDVTIKLTSRVRDVTVSSKNGSQEFLLSTEGTTPTERFSKIILATGGSRQGFDLASSLGHSIVPPVPSLFTFKIKDPRLEDLAGISFAGVKLLLHLENEASFSQTGPLLITHWGLSGPGIIKLSALGARELYNMDYKAKLSINLLPQYSEESILAALLQKKREAPRRELGSSTFDNVPRRYWLRLLEFLSFPSNLSWADASKKQLRELGAQLVAASFSIEGKGVFKEEFVTCGGVYLKEVDFRTMQSRICPGLYFAGEVLDIDGLTGGFNFQAAWTTAWIAGQNAGIGNDS